MLIIGNWGWQIFCAISWAFFFHFHIYVFLGFSVSSQSRSLITPRVSIYTRSGTNAFAWPLVSLNTGRRWTNVNPTEVNSAQNSPKQIPMGWNVIQKWSLNQVNQKKQHLCIEWEIIDPVSRQGIAFSQPLSIYTQQTPSIFT